MIFFKPANGADAFRVQFLAGRPGIFLAGNEAAEFARLGGRVRRELGQFMGHVHADVFFAIGQFWAPGENFFKGRMIGRVPIIRPHRRAFKKDQINGLVPIFDQPPKIRVQLGWIIQKNHRIKTFQRRGVNGGDVMPEFFQIGFHIHPRITQIIPDPRRSIFKHLVIIIAAVKIIKTQIHDWPGTVWFRGKRRIPDDNPPSMGNDGWDCKLDWRPCLPDAIFLGMSITATVEQGKIVLPANIDWPSGTVVRIEPVGDQPPTLWETLKDFDGIASDLPTDLADNLDHYVHGHARP
jgi:hypothetical protein